MHSRTSFVAMRASRVPSDAFAGQAAKTRGLGFHLSNLIDDLGIGQRRDVAGILVVRNRSENAAHDLPGTGLWHIGDNHDMARTSDRPYLTDHGVFHALADVLAGGKPRLQRYVEIRNLALDFVLGRNHCRLGDLLNKQAGGLDLLGPKPMSGDVDDIVDSTQDAIIAICRLQGAVAGHVRPIAPVTARSVLAVARVVLLDEAIGVFPNRLK